ncbi:MAG TPA: bifunctional diaminohydroxyphosphoribosylaminopyrimidine deaminase/5-amino-6-(5-phosphoribosylamino)uracil reductase RibD [Fimbriimonadaceae bacterium]|nr:bifunctional diaminohydroxyphosphoribosylaminopyrimidine deaminase/5-amino-6-(5-phosphoribosylamino)uracil reductase RibD [Fimbriimonadaceae bacterium]
MQRAVALSKRGYPAPNPHVGCVIVKDGAIVGEGYHNHAGGPHAEVAALRAAGPRAAGASVYVTMEPCNHHGRTPPCSEALLAAGVAKVSYAVSDPNPVAGGGAEALRAAGIAVSHGLLANEAEAANEMWLTAVRRRRPYVVAKAAASLDAKAALPTGESKWITGESARRRGHVLRAECGAVMVGRRTVLADEPLLTARIPRVPNQPTRIILDRNGQLSPDHRVFDNSAPSLRVVGPGAKHEGMLVPMKGDGFDLPALLDRLYGEGFTSILVEGGPTTLGAFFAAGLVDRLHLFVAPKVLGDGIDWVRGMHVATLAQAPEFKLLQVRRHGPDLELILSPRG